MAVPLDLMKLAWFTTLNRGNARNRIFFKDGDDEVFERVIAEALERSKVDLYSYQWMPNHWHMVISPRVDRAMSEFFQLITLTAQLILKIPIREFKRRGAESAEEVLLKELCVLCDSAFKTSTRNLKFSHRAAEITYLRKPPCSLWLCVMFSFTWPRNVWRQAKHLGTKHLGNPQTCFHGLFA